MTVYTDAALKDPAYKLRGQLNQGRYLEILTRMNFHDVCLGIAFTYTDFPGNNLGLAYVGVANRNGPGICYGYQVRWRTLQLWLLENSMLTDDWNEETLINISPPFLRFPWPVQKKGGQ